MGFYANSELTQNILLSVIPANKIFKIRFKFGYSDRSSDGLSFKHDVIVDTKAKVYLLNHFSYCKDFTTWNNINTCNNAWKRVEKVVSTNIGQSFQAPNQWHTYESEWLSVNKNITTIAVGGFGGCENDRNDYIYMDDIEIITAGSCPTCIKMNEPLIPGIKMNVFTPNTDGVNDILYHEYENMTHYNLYVYDPYMNKIVYCVENKPAAVSTNGLPAVAWDGSKTNQNCKRVGGFLQGNTNYQMYYKVWNCSHSYQPQPFNITKISYGNNGNAPGLFPADSQYWLVV